MAIAAGTLFEIAATGSDGQVGADTNSGGFNPSNANFPTDLTTNANTGNTSTPVVSSATYNFQAGDVGHWVFLQSSGSWSLPTVSIAGVTVTPTGLWAKISSVAANKATLDASVGNVVLYGTGGPFTVNTTIGISTQATPTAGKFGVDYSQGGVTPCQITDAVTTSASVTITSASNKFHKAMVGNLCFLSGGTGSIATAVFEIVSDTGVGTIIVDRSGGIATGTGATLNVGGCLASPGMAGQFHVGGNHLFCKKATYSVTSATANVTGGCLSLAAGLLATYTSVFGYGSVRTDFPQTTNRPTLQASGISTFTLVKPASGTVNIWCLILDGASLAGSTGTSGTTTSRWLWCSVKNCKSGGFATNGNAFFCDATSCDTTAAFTCTSAFWCSAWSNTITGFSGVNCTSCISANNSGASSDGFAMATVTNTRALNSLAYNNGRHGFNITTGSTNSNELIQCIAHSNTSNGFNANATADCCLLYKCAAYNNTGTNFLTASAFTLDTQLSCITCTADPCTNVAGGDFSLNATAGGGALLRAAGVIGAFPGLTSTSTAMDIGPVQHADPVGGGSSLIICPPRRIQYYRYYPILRRRLICAYQGVLVMRVPPRQVQVRQVTRRNVFAALLVAPPVLVPVRTPVRQVQVRQVTRRTNSVIIPGSNTVTSVPLIMPPRRIQSTRYYYVPRRVSMRAHVGVLVMRVPPRQVQVRQVTRRVVPVAIFTTVTVTQLIIVRSPPRYINRVQVPRRNAANALFASLGSPIQTILVSSPRKVR